MSPVIERNATEIRKNFAQTLNDSEYHKPQFFRRNRCGFGVVSVRDIERLTSTASVDVHIAEHPGIFVATSDTISDIVSEGDTRDSAIAAFCEDLYEYAREYYENYELYSASPNRAPHAPYVFRALFAEGPSDLKGMLILDA